MRELRVMAPDGHAFALRLHDAAVPRACVVIAPAMGVAAPAPTPSAKP